MGLATISGNLSASVLNPASNHFDCFLLLATDLCSFIPCNHSGCQGKSGSELPHRLCLCWVPGFALQKELGKALRTNQGKDFPIKTNAQTC